MAPLTVLRSSKLLSIKYETLIYRYPSLRAKKYNESQNIWQIRINAEYRAYFRIDGDTYVLIAICKHPKYSIF
ncbi:hypothetical protein [Candidatus Magnetobacterium casense]|uniref:ParE family toxin-like protein n=1 Tax=Candidatus Magnetobacterium casense TaxID=1455061 RepID=UPI003CC9192C